MARPKQSLCRRNKRSIISNRNHQIAILQFYRVLKGLDLLVQSRELIPCLSQITQGPISLPASKLEFIVEPANDW